MGQWHPLEAWWGLAKVNSRIHGDRIRLTNSNREAHTRRPDGDTERQVDNYCNELKGQSCNQEGPSYRALWRCLKENDISKGERWGANKSTTKCV